MWLQCLTESSCHPSFTKRFLCKASSIIYLLFLLEHCRSHFAYVKISADIPYTSGNYLTDLELTRISKFLWNLKLHYWGWLPSLWFLVLFQSLLFILALRESLVFYWKKKSIENTNLMQCIQKQHHTWHFSINYCFSWFTISLIPPVHNAALVCVVLRKENEWV